MGSVIENLYRDIFGTTFRFQQTDSKELLDESLQTLKDVAEKELICNLIEVWLKKHNDQEELYDKTGIDLVNYNEDFYFVFRTVVLMHFKSEQIVELVQWYCTDRNEKNEDGSLQNMYNENDEVIDISTVEKFYEYMTYLNTFQVINLQTLEDNEDEDLDENDGDDE